jgi:hypothetical protein
MRLRTNAPFPISSFPENPNSRRKMTGRDSNIEIRNYMRNQAGSRSLVFGLSITHDRYGSSSHVQQNGLLSHPPRCTFASCCAAENQRL